MTTRRTTRMLVLAIATVALALTGCSGQPGADASEPGGDGGEVDVVGVWGDPDARTEPSLTFADDGTVGGTDGCNQIGGTYALDGGTVEFSDMISTMMACPDVDAWLSAASSATVDGDTMTVLDDSGAEIGTLDRR